MNYKVSYADAVKEFPEQTAAALAKLRASRCRNRNADPNTLPWCFAICVHGQCMSFEQVISELGKPKPQLTAEQQLQDLISRTKSDIMVVASKDSWYFEPLPHPPKVYIDQQREGYKKSEERNKRFNALPKEEQNKETANILGQLGKDPGFMAFHIK